MMSCQTPDKNPELGAQIKCHISSLHHAHPPTKQNAIFLTLNETKIGVLPSR
jgi:hypothetical protein